jgi:hypothetical protein
MSTFVEAVEKYRGFLPFFIEIADKMSRGELFKEDVNFLLANLIDSKASFHRKEWLEHEVRCLELKKISLEEEKLN